MRLTHRIECKPLAALIVTQAHPDHCGGTIEPSPTRRASARWGVRGAAEAALVVA